MRDGWGDYAVLLMGMCHAAALLLPEENGSKRGEWMGSGLVVVIVKPSRSLKKVYLQACPEMCRMCRASDLSSRHKQASANPRGQPSSTRLDSGRYSPKQDKARPPKP